MKEHTNAESHIEFVDDAPEMKVADVRAAIAKVVDSVHNRAVGEIGSRYVDYVTVTFVGFASSLEPVVTAYFRQLCDRFGWTELRVTAAKPDGIVRTVLVTMSQGNMIRTDDARMR